MIELFAGPGGTVSVPQPGHALIDRADGGHLIVTPPRRVWERSALSSRELAAWGELVAAVGRSMLHTLPQLTDGCINYWEASNWLLHNDAVPQGPKSVRAHRDVHLHVIGRSRQALHPAWQWGEAPAFPRFADRQRWSAEFAPLTVAECQAVVQQLTERVCAPTRCALVVFDLAGTTVRDDGAIAIAFERALSSVGIVPTSDDIVAARGLSKHAAFNRLVPPGPEHDARVLAVDAAFRAELASAVANGALRAMDGAETTFAALRARGVRVAMTTGLDRETMTLMLEALQWNRGQLDAMVCADDVPSGRPSPFMIFRAMENTGVSDVRAVAVVGDTTADLLAGHNAGAAWNVGVLGGAHSERQLRAAPHTALIDSVAQLLNGDVIDFD